LRRWSRRPRSVPVPEHDQYPAEIAGLLHDVQSLRTTMASDLSAAAGAVDSDQPAVAGDIIEGGRRDLAHLGQPSPGLGPGGRALPQPRDHRRTSTRSGVRTVLIATVPLLAVAAVGAAAVTAYTIDQHDPSSPGARHQTRLPGVPSPGASADRPAATAAAAATLHALTVAVRRGASPATIAAIAALLHDQLASIAAASGGNSQRLAAVRRMLAAEDHLLSGNTDPRIAVELRAVRQLETTLTGHPSPVTHAPSVSQPPSPGSTTLPRPRAPTATPTRPAGQPTNPPRQLPSTPTPRATSSPLPIPTISPILPSP
jgi:hypothetical protein